MEGKQHSVDVAEAVLDSLIVSGNRRDLEIVQGKGSRISTEWSPEGWVRVAGRVVSDGTKQID